MPKSLRPFLARRLWLPLLILAGVAAGMALSLNSRVTVPHFSWAKAQGWDVQPVRVVRLSPPWLMPFERIPDGPSPQETALFRTCWTARFGAQRQGQTLAAKQVYEHVLARHPHFFYAEYQIADWYREHHSMALYHTWLQQSLRDAPAVLAGRIEYDDGGPVKNALAALHVTVYDKRHLTGNVAYGWYNFVTTDDEGCWYLPVFKGIYGTDGTGLRFDSLWDAQGKNLNIDIPEPELSHVQDEGAPRARLTLGMIAAGHVGILPKIIARPKIQITSPLGQQISDLQHPISIRGNVMDLAWRPVPGAVRYQVEITERGNGFRSDAMIAPNDPHFRNGASSTEVKIPLNGTDGYDGNAPLFDRNTPYGLMIYAHSSNDPNNFQDVINASDEYDFLPADAVAPLALTKANFAHALGPGAVVFSIQIHDKQVVVTGVAPRETINAVARSNNLDERFGLQRHDAQFGTPDAQDHQKFSMTFSKP